MNFKVFIRDNATGDIRERGPTEFDSEFAAYWCYSEGNYGCDCNRRDFFHNNAPDMDGLCGHSEYSVRVLREDGTELYSDFDGRDI